MHKSAWFVYGALFLTILIALFDGGKNMVEFLGEIPTVIATVICLLGAFFCIGMGIVITWKEQREISRKKEENIGIYDIMANGKRRTNVDIKTDNRIVLFGIVAMLIAMIIFNKKRGVIK